MAKEKSYDYRLDPVSYTHLDVYKRQAPGGIGGQLDFLAGIKGVHGLNQPDGANGTQILHAHIGVLDVYKRQVGCIS